MNDTALRIGAHSGLKPARVFVHAGVRDGARALGFDGRRTTIDPSVFAELAPTFAQRRIY